MSHPILMTAQLAGASLGLVSGALNLGLAANPAWRRAAANLFFASMLAVTACGAWLAWPEAAGASFLAWVLGLQLFAGAWLAQRERGGAPALLVAALAMAVGIAAVAAGLKAGPAAAGYFLMGGIALFACGVDAQSWRSALPAPRRAQRRQWCGATALALAVTAFCLDQQLLPEQWRGSPLPFLPTLLVLAVLIWWMNRTPRGGAPVGRRPRKLAPRQALGSPRMAL